MTTNSTNLSFDWPDYVIFALLLIFYLLIGIYHRFRHTFRRYLPCVKAGDKSPAVIQVDANNVEKATTNDEVTEDLFYANRQMSLYPILSTVLASYISAVSLMGTSRQAYQYGMQFVCIAISYIFGFGIAAEVYAPFFYRLKLTSAHQYLEFRFSKKVRWLTSVVFFLQMFTYCAVAIFTPALAVSQVSGLSIYVSIIACGIVTTIYTAFGGIRAVVWTDAIQLGVVTLGLLFIMVYGIYRVGGPIVLWETSLAGKRLTEFDFNPDPTIPNSFWTLSIGAIGMMLSLYGTNQTQIQRYMACRDLRTARLSLWLSLPFCSIFLVIQLVCGLVAYTLFADCDPLLDGRIKQYDQILPYLVMVLFDNIPLVRGLFLSVIFAAAISTMSSCINSLANSCLDDLLAPCLSRFRMSQRKKLWTAWILALLIGLGTIGLAFLFVLIKDSRVLSIAFGIFGALGGPILTIFTIGMFCPGVNAKGGLAALICSLLTGLFLITDSFINPSPRASLPMSTSGCSSVSNASSTNTTTSSSPGRGSLSHFYYSLACLIVGFVVGHLVSAFTGFNCHTPVNSRLLIPQVARLYDRIWNRSLPPPPQPTGGDGDGEEKIR